VTEIRVDVDLAHPPERVWRILTEVHLVIGWLPTANFLVTEDNHFTFRTDLDGLEEQIKGQTVTVEHPHKLVMRWEATNLHTLLSITLQPTETGCRLSIAQRGFLGPQGALRGRMLQRTYREVLEGPMVRALDRLAAAPDPASSRPVTPPTPKRNEGAAFHRLPRQYDGRNGNPPRSNSAPGLTSHVRAAAGPSQAGAMPGFAAAVLGAQAAAAGRPTGVVPAEEVAKHRQRFRRFRGLVSYLRARLRSLRPSRSGSGGGSAGSDGGSAGSVDPRGSLGPAGSGGPRGSGGPGGLRGGPAVSRERRSQAVAAAAALLLLLAMVALLVGRATESHPPRAPQTGGGSGDALDAVQPGLRLSPDDATAAPQPAAAPFTPSSGSAPPQLSPPPPLSPVASMPLSATYKMESRQVSGYDATITIVNRAPSPAEGWSVTITLPLLDLQVRAVQGAVTSVNGKNITFTPIDATRTVEPGGQVRVSFTVDGIGPPAACTIDDRSCAGIPE
jgi:uncharacterized protein YndB with AHSA1/START domain